MNWNGKSTYGGGNGGNGEHMCGNNGRKQRTGTQSLFGHMNKTRKDKTPSGAKINGGHYRVTRGNLISMQSSKRRFKENGLLLTNGDKTMTQGTEKAAALESIFASHFLGQLCSQTSAWTVWEGEEWLWREEGHKLVNTWRRSVCTQTYRTTWDILMDAEKTEGDCNTTGYHSEKSLLLQNILDDWRKVNFTYILNKSEVGI